VLLIGLRRARRGFLWNQLVHDLHDGGGGLLHAALQPRIGVESGGWANVPRAEHLYVPGGMGDHQRHLHGADVITHHKERAVGRETRPACHSDAQERW
jgi:hypothetical protein